MTDVAQEVKLTILFGPFTGLKPQSGEGHVAQIPNDGETLGAWRESQSPRLLLETEPDEIDSDQGGSPHNNRHSGEQSRIPRRARPRVCV